MVHFRLLPFWLCGGSVRFGEGRWRGAVHGFYMEGHPEVGGYFIVKELLVALDDADVVFVVEIDSDGRATHFRRRVLECGGQHTLVGDRCQERRPPLTNIA